MTEESDLDFICYLQPGWRMLIRPAEPTRPWMDASPEAFAYRCLPMNIANAHGWEIITPAGVNAYWQGGGLPSDVIIQSDPDMPHDMAPVAIFGQAVLTFHINGIFRTPPGWNLMIGGSPNRAKDAIAPLSGIIETDWSPFSFTMNWRFTRRNHWIRFDPGEVIGFIMPVQRHALSQMNPRLAPIAESTDTARQFDAWSKSRNEFHAEIARNRPATASGQWQKHYYRGLDMDGKEAADHQTKLRLKPFVNPGDQSHEK